MATKTMQAQVIEISTKEHSYAIFCYTDAGDLFINSDWGFYGFAWRSFGDNFRDFLIHLDSDYMMGKLELNAERTINATKKKNIMALFELFKAQLNKPTQGE